MPHDLPVTLALVLLTLASAAAAVLALRRLRVKAGRGAEGESSSGESGDADAPVPWVRGLSLGVTLGAAAVLAYRWMRGGTAWQLVAHVDGLLMIGGLLALAAWYVQSRPRLRGLAGFVLVGVAFVLAWAICAAAWTYHPFNLERLDPVWEALHLGGVYLGTISAALAAAAGAMYLFAHRRLKRHKPPLAAGRIASLETLETVIVRCAAMGFVLLTLGLVAGVVVITHAGDGGTRLGEQWWLTPKIILSAGAWTLYAVLMNARRASAFRGSYAAWLAIAALVLLLSVYGVVTAVPGGGVVDPPESVNAVPAAASEGGVR